MARDPQTGVCVMRLTAGLDSGPVALRAEVELGDDEDYGTLAPRLAALGGDLLVEALDLLADGTLAFTEQDEAAVTYAEKISRRGAPPRPGPARRRTWRRRCAPLPRTSAPTWSWRAASGSGCARRALSTRSRRGGRGRFRSGRTRARRGRGRGRGALRRHGRGTASPRCGPAGRRQSDAGRRLPARPSGAEARVRRRCR